MSVSDVVAVPVTPALGEQRQADSWSLVAASISTWHMRRHTVSHAQRHQSSKGWVAEALYFGVERGASRRQAGGGGAQGLSLGPGTEVLLTSWLFLSAEIYFHQKEKGKTV